MTDQLRILVLRLLRVPHEPSPPAGAQGSVRIFRAGRRYLTLQLIGWGLARTLVLAGLVFWTVVLLRVETTVQERRLHPVSPQQSPQQGQTLQSADPLASATPPVTPGKSIRKKIRGGSRFENWKEFQDTLVDLLLRLPPWAFHVIWALKILGYLGFLIEATFAFVLRHLDYELRWYIVTDRSLRIRSGILRLQESTMSFANLQQVETRQNPLQRLFGLADVQVKSAGGSEGPTDKKQGESLHLARFHAVENATEIRDLILTRLKHFREAGLGDPDDKSKLHPSAPNVLIDPAQAELEAARELLAEARALRQSLGSA